MFHLGAKKFERSVCFCFSVSGSQFNQATFEPFYKIFLLSLLSREELTFVLELFKNQTKTDYNYHVWKEPVNQFDFQSVATFHIFVWNCEVQYYVVHSALNVCILSSQIGVTHLHQHRIRTECTKFLNQSMGWLIILMTNLRQMHFVESLGFFDRFTFCLILTHFEKNAFKNSSFVYFVRLI